MFGAAADPSLDAGIVLGAGTREEPLGGEGLDAAGDVGRGQRVQYFLDDHEFGVTAVMSGLIGTLAVAAIWSIFQ
ncbi:hypothetical protein WSS_A29609 [Rhodococcus opacus M213]|uniref:Uncharacterized protein n=1 Tax=Rhodococcus opacus M213 TaxID=1129896 RepID=K8XDQ1_RHOOP|nr:hypothetical protein [Rhodococcus opacus]EKT78971.1 hypothetical protein WSS_A29609 [Rhodococcus opacus M213]